MQAYGINQGQSPDFKEVSFTSSNRTWDGSNDKKPEFVSSRTAALKAQYQIKKRLNYNMREISSQILRANKAQSASIVLVRAKFKVSSLKRCYGTGQYDVNEVRPALAHAQRMVRVANKKVQNLKEEEREQRQLNNRKAEKVMERKREVKAAIAQKKQAKKVAEQIEEMNEIRQEKMKRQVMEQKRRMHRSNERGKITEADMKYIHDRLEDKWDTDWEVDLDGVVCSISASAAGLSNLENIAVLLDGAEAEAALGMVDGGAAMAVEGGAVDISL